MRHSKRAIKKRIPESDLIVPTLEALQENANGLKTRDLIEILTKRLGPSGRDAEILQNRSDTRFSQKVRNLKSHNTLTRKNLATYDGEVYKITQLGREYLEKFTGITESLIIQGLSASERSREFKNSYKGLIIEEGALIVRNAKIRKRSIKLVGFARDYFRKRDGGLHCQACGFDFEKIYDGPGKGYIEIHHSQPVHEYDFRGKRSRIEVALKK